MSVLITIITINFNNDTGLRKTIQSVINQSYNEFEYIVIDGASNDGSIAILKEYEEHIRLWISEPDKGIYDAMNKGILKASGDYLQFLNSGDTFASNDTLINCTNKIKERPNVDIFYGNVWLCKNDGGKYLLKFPKNLDLTFFKKSFLNHQSTFIRKDLFIETGLYPLKFLFISDYYKFLSFFLAGKTFLCLEHTVAKYDLHGISSDSSNYSRMQEEKNTIWKLLVPDYIQQLIIDNEVLNHQLKDLRTSTKLQLKAILLNQKRIIASLIIKIKTKFHPFMND